MCFVSCGVAKVAGASQFPIQSVSFAHAAPRKIEEEPKMFCFQCEQTKSRRGCTQIGVCGKTPETAKLQDLLIHVTKGLAIYADKAKSMGIAINQEVPDLLVDSLFSTVTNVNFDENRFPPMINDIIKARDTLKNQYEAKTSTTGRRQAQYPSEHPASYRIPSGAENNVDVLEREGEKYSLINALKKYGPSVRGVREMCIYGLKGAAAYYAHARKLGQQSSEVEDMFYQVLAWLETASESGRGDLAANLGQALKVGEANLKTLNLLDVGHNLQFGTPSPTSVQLTPKAGKCLLVSGHDLHDLDGVLKYLEDKNVNVYTHGEMLPAHGYPGLRKYKCLAGHFGGGWQLQQYEFPHFPGPILVTTNCLVEPRKSYFDSIFTTNVVGWPGAKHISIENQDDLKLLESCAQSMAGFSEAEETSAEKKNITVGFGHGAIMSHAATVIEAVKSGALKRVFVVGGCDGSENKRNYFTELVEGLPDDTLILTMGCAKYRFNRIKDFGTLGDTGIPRLLDMGQCNDSYGAVQVALALANAFETDINSLPLTLCISWFEQKAVAVLLTLLHLGVKNVHLGPVMPAFMTEEVCDVLKEKFNLLPIELKYKRNAKEDIGLYMAGQL